jgi:hypothetical protein
MREPHRHSSGRAVGARSLRVKYPGSAGAGDRHGQHPKRMSRRCVARCKCGTGRAMCARAHAHTHAQIQSYIRAIVPLHVHCLQVDTDWWSKSTLTDDVVTDMWRVGPICKCCKVCLVRSKSSRSPIAIATGPVRREDGVGRASANTGTH